MFTCQFAVTCPPLNSMTVYGAVLSTHAGRMSWFCVTRTAPVCALADVVGGGVAPGTGVPKAVSVVVDESDVVAVAYGPEAWCGVPAAPRSIWKTPVNMTTNPMTSTTARRTMGRRKLGDFLFGDGDPGKDEDGSIRRSSDYIRATSTLNHQPGEGTKRKMRCGQAAATI